jgi:predicted HicB family RNase H-like nuclease
MTRFLLHHGLEDRDQFLCEVSRLLRQRKQAEGEKGIEAFAEACAQKGVLERPRFEARRQMALRMSGSVSRRAAAATVLEVAMLARMISQRL